MGKEGRDEKSHGYMRENGRIGRMVGKRGGNRQRTGSEWGYRAGTNQTTPDTITDAEVCGIGGK